MSPSTSNPNSGTIRNTTTLHMHFDDFTDRLQHGEDTDDSLDGILRI